VYRARDVELGRDVAVKVPLGAALNSRDLERLRREAAVISRLRHPGIVALHQLIECGGAPVLVMELVDGVPLSEVLASLRDCAARGESWQRLLATHVRRGDLDHDAAVCEVLRQLLEALDHAHGHGVVHRDLKPSNVMIDTEGRVRVLDFGLASTDDRASLSCSGLLGTPQFLAPELLDDPGRVGPWTDVYAAGVIAYELLTLRHPFGAGAVDAVLARIRAGDVIAARHARPEIEVDLGAIVECAIAPRPAERYPSCRAFLEDLARFADGRPTSARPVGWLGRTARRARRRPDLAASLAAVLVLIAAGAVWWIGAQRDAAARESQRGERVAQAHERAADLIAAESWERALDALAAADSMVAGEAETGAHGALRRDAAAGRDLERLLIDAGAHADAVAGRRLREVLSGLGLGDVLEAGLAANGDVAAAGAAVRAHRLREPLLRALDAWAVVLLVRGGDAELAGRVVALANAADGVPAHARLRSARIDRDVDALREVADSEAVLSLPARMLLWLAHGLAALRDPERARRVFRQVTILHPGDYAGHLAYAKFLVYRSDARDDAAAIQCFRAALALKPHDARLIGHLAHSLVSVGDRELAVEMAHRAIAADPECSDGWRSLAWARLNAADADQALPAAQRAVDTAANPEERAGAFTVLAVAHSLRGDAAAARRSYESANEAWPTAMLAASLISHCRETGDEEGADALLTEAAQRYPGDLELRGLLAAREADRGDLARAVQLYAELFAVTEWRPLYLRTLLLEAAVLALRLAAADPEGAAAHRALARTWLRRWLGLTWRAAATMTELPPGIDGELGLWTDTPEIAATRADRGGLTGAEAEGWERLWVLYEAMREEISREHGPPAGAVTRPAAGR
jgi:tetratricopeptide (TPR) repeat protein